MNKEVETLGVTMMIHQSVDRQVMGMMIRALLIDASPEKVAACHDFLSVLRAQFETVVSNASDDTTNGQARTALLHFESWELQIERQLQDKMKPMKP